MQELLFFVLCSIYINMCCKNWTRKDRISVIGYVCYKVRKGNFYMKKMIISVIAVIFIIIIIPLVIVELTQPRSEQSTETVTETPIASEADI